MSAPPSTLLRWVELAYPRAFGAAARPTPDAVAAAWMRSQRAIAARLALACARENLVDAEVTGGALHLALGGDRGADLPLARLGAFGLHTAAADRPADALFDDPLALLAALARPLDLNDADRLRLGAELRDSATNLALAYLTAALRDAQIAGGEAWPAPVDPENLVTEGHPWHPMTKTRLGLRRAEVLRHAPEHLARAGIAAVDVDASLVQLAGDARAALAELFPAPPPGFVRLPVHPAQLRRLPRLVPEHWGAAIRPAAIPPRPSRALLSLRTVAVDAPACHLKLALAVVTTSARRTVSPMSVTNGPPLTRLLAAIAGEDPAIAALQVLGDRAAAGLSPALGDAAAHLGVIVRDPPEALARAASGSATAEAWVCAALGERRPGAAEPSLLARLAARHDSAEGMLRRYVDRLVTPALRLLSGYGVALELHLQNTLVSVDDAGLVGFIVRDLGGVRILPRRLAARGHALSFAPGSFIATDDVAELRDKLSHTLLHAHLGAVIRWAERDLGLPAARSWAHVRAAILRVTRALADDVRARPDALADRDALLRPRCRSKALLQMRVDRRVSDYAYGEVDNILARRDVIDLAAAGEPLS
ncbi:MAG: IucA/IucC family protein [Nannocystaceae bacterium]